VTKQQQRLLAAIICLALMAPLIYGISLLIHSEFAVMGFYRARPLLQALRSADDPAWNEARGARLQLLQQLPLGTEKAGAMGALSREGFSCQDMSGQLVDCQLLAPASMGYTRWIVDLQFNDGNLLRDANVKIWNVFL
jgi:hypothetical protein